jgi:hypothetical protein
MDDEIVALCFHATTISSPAGYQQHDARQITKVQRRSLRPDGYGLPLSNGFGFLRNHSMGTLLLSPSANVMLTLK